MSKTEHLRNLPSVDEVLRSDLLDEFRHRHAHRQLADWSRQAIQRARERILAGDELLPQSAMTAVIACLRELEEADAGQSIQPVINATGIVLHTNLGRAPLADRALDRLVGAGRACNVELNLQSGRRSKRGERATRLLAELAGSDDAVVVNNCAAATYLVLQTIAAGREVIVSRGQLVEIGGGFRLPDVFRSSGATLREVGTTNRTYLRDYEAAVGDETGAIIRVHRSNFQLAGFVTEPTIDEMVAIQRPKGVPVIDDLGSGCMEDLSDLGLTEPNVPDSVAAGADLTLFSGDKLFGGPQCGIIVGQSHWIERLRRSPMMRAMRVDKLTLAALEATTEIHLSGNSRTDLPILQMLSLDPEVIRQRCETIANQLAPLVSIEVVPCESQVGGGSIPGSAISSFGLKISVDHVDDFARELRGGANAVQGRVSDDALLLDLRTVMESQLGQLVAKLTEVIRRTPPGATTA